MCVCARIMAVKGSEMLPFQGYCAEVVFIDHSSVATTYELTCIVFQVCFHLSINVTDIFLYKFIPVKLSQVALDFFNCF